MADFALTVLPATPVFLNADSAVLSVVPVGINVQYAQRVWSTGSSVWCYYIGPVNASPASTDTTPNWVTSAIRHEVLGPT